MILCCKSQQNKINVERLTFPLDILIFVALLTSRPPPLPQSSTISRSTESDTIPSRQISLVPGIPITTKITLQTKPTQKSGKQLIHVTDILKSKPLMKINFFSGQMKISVNVTLEM